VPAEVGDPGRFEVEGSNERAGQPPQPGEMARRVQSLDWSRTPLGPATTWPAHLRTAVDICLNTGVPLMIVWGPEGIQIYNDALTPVLGDKHPQALGRPYAESFAEIWDYQGPKFRAVLERGQPTYDQDEEVCFFRNGRLEEMYYTFSWSPIHSPEGTVDGAFHPATETTGYVVAARRLAALRALAYGTGDPGTPERACQLAAAALKQHRKDMPFALLYLLDSNGTRCRVAAAMGVDPVGGGPPSVEIGSTQDLWNLAEALRTGPTVIDIDAGIQLADAPWPEPCRQAMVLPLTGEDGTDPLGLLVAGISPRRPLDEDYVTWLELIKAQLDRALASASARERDHRIAVTLQRSLFPGTLPAVDGVILDARYRPALEYTEVGGDWYDAICVDEDVIVVVGDVMGHGVRAAATMGRLRSATQAYAMLGLSPAAVLKELNRFAVRLDDVEFATVLCARYSPSSGSFVFASAGHPAPVLVTAGGDARLVGGGLTVPLAVTDDLWAAEHGITLSPGDFVLLYTDGLVEHRDQPLDRGLARLVAFCTEHHGDHPAALLDGLMEEVAWPDSRDDVAVLALQRIARRR
jgi:hypothetical protein